MAYWKENINVEVLLPFDTPNCTTSWYWVTFPIALEETWYADGIWMYNAGDFTPHRINICGKAILKGRYDDPVYGPVDDIRYTTYNLMACSAINDTTYPTRSDVKHFKVRLVSRDKQLSDQDKRSMRLHSIDYGSYIYKPQNK